MTLQGHDPAADPTTNVTVHIEYTERDKKLWDFFDRATFDALSVMSNKHQLEYWHEGAMGKPGFWTRERPPQNELRIPGVVHEASTLFMGREEDGGSVNENYLLHGTENVVSGFCNSMIFSMNLTMLVFLVRYWSSFVPYLWELEPNPCDVWVCSGPGRQNCS